MKLQKVKTLWTIPLMFMGVLGTSAQTISVQDWLLKPITAKAEVTKSADGKDIVLQNGLLKRVFRISPNLVCIDYTNLSTGQQLLRSVREEARLIINGKTYNIGGLQGQQEKAYLLPEWVDGFKMGTTDFKYISYEVKPITPRLKWNDTRYWALRTKPATGKTVSFLYRPQVAELSGLEVNVVYELYDGIPLIVKFLSIVNKGSQVFKIDQVVNEVLGMVEDTSVQNV